ncbi:helix-turn-helix domain-containing protein [Aquimarina longa]|uniref:helix-turn-helix domain-containing protein n=1 Tax=Aquimarina longa TaxID=1080221 RepID=UPI00078304D9|nr:helix-turn-helix domain-containing protein [Aquimarina longa]
MQHRTPNKLLDEILNVIATHYNVDTSYILQNTRVNEIVWKRQLFFHFSRKYLKDKLSYREIGKYPKQHNVKGYNHATVLHSFRVVQNVIETDKNERIQYNEINEKIQYALNVKCRPSKNVLKKIEILINTTELTIEQLSRAYKISVNQIKQYVNG